MDEPKEKPADFSPDETAALARRDFLAGMGKWSTVVIGGIALAGILGQPRRAEAGGWVNRRVGGGGWANARGGYGGGWVNGRGGGGGWVNGGGGGGGWVNRRGLGGGWVNYR